jgi:dienelactone hydrolase
MKRIVSDVLVACALCAGALPAFSGSTSPQTSEAQSAAPPLQQSVLPGQITDKVVCTDFPGYSYALYLPTNYTPGRRWPIIYAFDPGARGQIPVKLYRDAAEKYGYIVVGSNNSKNFSSEPAARSILALWQDTHQRLALDDRRIYTTGFSGGSRTATMVALHCATCAVTGVIAHGAGYPGSDTPSAKNSFLYFGAVGNQDFNWGEMMDMRRTREDLGLPYRMKVFDGEHQWAPSALAEEAIEWLQLKAMQSGSMPADGAFLGRLLEEMTTEARQAESRGDAIGALNAYRSLVSDFRGLKEVSEFDGKLAALKKSAALGNALKKERDEIREQATLTETISAQLSQLGDTAVSDQFSLREKIQDGLNQLREQARRSKNERDRLVRQRAFHQLWAQGIECGQAEFKAKHFTRAESYFHLMADVAPDEWWPLLLLAETRTSMGDHKHAILDLREAIRRGLKNADTIERDDDLQPLLLEPDLRTLLAELTTK